MKTKHVISYLLLVCFIANSTLIVSAYDDNESTAQVERDSSPEELGFVPDQVLISYHNSIDESIIEQAVESNDATITETITDVNDEVVSVVNIADDKSVGQAVEELEADPNISSVSPNYIFHVNEEESEKAIASAMSTNDADASKQSYLSQLNDAAAWGKVQSVSHQKVRVVVLDTGADIYHEDLSGVLNQSLSKEVIINDDNTLSLQPLQGDGYINGADVSSEYKISHGTHVAGIIAAEANNGKGIAGVGSGGDNSVIDLVAVDVFSETNTAYLSCIIKGMSYALDLNADIVNMSLGITGDFSGVTKDYFKEACDMLEEHGVTVVCAAGNDNTCDNGNITTVPSDYDSTISVINVYGSTKEKSPTSNYGELKDISAPGISIYSTYDHTSFGKKYDYMSGTSMAAPMVTGVAAMLYSVDSTMTPSRVRQILQDTATDIGAKGFDIYTGYGFLNAKAAVESVVGTEPVQKVTPHWVYQYGSWYYIVSDGSICKDGWVTIGNDQYYLDQTTGKMHTGWIWDNGWYLTKPSGQKIYGWYWDSSNRIYYYLDPSQNGLMSRNCLVGDYYVNGSGVMVKNCWQRIDNHWYWFNGSGAMMKNGWLRIQSVWYFFDNDGKMAMNRLVGSYYVNGSGVIVTGWKMVDGSWYFFRLSGGEMYRNGWQKLGNVWYYFKTDGKMAQNEWIGPYWCNSSGGWVAG